MCVPVQVVLLVGLTTAGCMSGFLPLVFGYERDGLATTCCTLGVQDLLHGRSAAHVTAMCLYLAGLLLLCNALCSSCDGRCATSSMMCSSSRTDAANCCGKSVTLHLHLGSCLFMSRGSCSCMQNSLELGQSITPEASWALVSSTGSASAHSLPGVTAAQADSRNPKRHVAKHPATTATQATTPSVVPHSGMLIQDRPGTDTCAVSRQPVRTLVSINTCLPNMPRSTMYINRTNDTAGARPP